MSSEKIINKTSEDKEIRADLIDQVYDAIAGKGDGGVIQTDICKEFSLHSRDGSRLLTGMEKRSLIVREKVLHKGRWTFKVIANKKPEVVKQKPVEVTSVNGAPCLCCSYQNMCTDDESSKYTPITCNWLEEWLVADYDLNVVNVQFVASHKPKDQ